MKKFLLALMFIPSLAFAADNVAVTAGTGTTVAAEDVSGVKYQRVKLIDSTASSTTPTGVTANPLQVALPAATVSTLTPPAAITGYATSAKQDTGNTSLSTIAANIPAQGQALAAGSMPVVLTAAQVSTLTPPAAITGYSTSTKQSDGSQKTQIVDGSGNVIASTSNALNVSLASVPSHAVTNAGTFAVQNTPAVGGGQTILSYTGSISATTDVIADPGVGKTIYVVGYSLITASGTANTITFQSNASTAEWMVTLQALSNTISGANLITAAPNYIFKCNAHEKLTLNFSSSQTTTVSISYFIV